MNAQADLEADCEALDDFGVPRMLPFDPAMERMSMFMPRYLSRLLTMVAMKEDAVKAKLIRNAILRELRAYADRVKTHNGGPYDKIAGPAVPTEPPADAEEDKEFVAQLYRDFANLDEKFPARGRLMQPAGREKVPTR